MPTTADDLVAELSEVVADARVLAAIRSVPRDAFVPLELRDAAWQNGPLPIGDGQTISQPTVVARMCELLELEGDETVLDVGTGSGYHAAVLSRLAARVVSIERHARLSRTARDNLRAAGIDTVTLVVGDGADGHAQEGPYDAISVAATGADGVPPALLAQLADGGRLVMPTGDEEQRLVRVRHRGGALRSESFERVRFVPLVTRR